MERCGRRIIRACWNSSQNIFWKFLDLTWVFEDIVIKAYKVKVIEKPYSIYLLTNALISRIPLSLIKLIFTIITKNYYLSHLLFFPLLHLLASIIFNLHNYLLYSLSTWKHRHLSNMLFVFLYFWISRLQS